MPPSTLPKGPQPARRKELLKWAVLAAVVWIAATAFSQAVGHRGSERVDRVLTLIQACRQARSAASPAASSAVSKPAACLELEEYNASRRNPKPFFPLFIFSSLPSHHA